MSTRRITALVLAILVVVPAFAEERFARELASVESIRGRSFTSEVKHRTLERAKLREFLRAQIDRDLPGGADGYLDALEAIFLIDEGTTVDPLLDLYDAQVLAFYDPAEHIYYSLDAPPPNVPMPEPMIEAVEVHELMHALQDQAFGAGRRTIELQSNWDAVLAYQSILEGEAVLVMLAHLGAKLGVDIGVMLAQEGMVEAMREAAARGESIPEGIPAYFVQSLQFPYVDGLAFVIEAYKAGGWKALDALHDKPPVSTEEILKPELYRARVATGVTPRQTPTKADDDELVRTVLGEFHWRFLLGAKAGDGWGSDRVVVRRGNGGATVLVESTWDTETDAKEFDAALRPLLETKKAKNAKVSLRGTRVLAAWGSDAKAIGRFVSGK